MRDAATSTVPAPRVRHDHTRDVDPHRQLMAAVLQTAVDDCWDSFSPRSAGYGSLAAGRRFRDARVYMLSKDRGWPFSFENLCDSLDLDARRLRRALLSAPKAGTTVRPSGPVTTEQILDWWRSR
jgi:hypothetical protein